MRKPFWSQDCPPTPPNPQGPFQDFCEMDYAGIRVDSLATMVGQPRRGGDFPPEKYGSPGGFRVDSPGFQVD